MAWPLFKIAFPLLALVHFLDLQFGVVKIAGDALAPAMAVAGLPGEAAIVWAAAMTLQIYAALAIMAGLWDALAMTEAQATILATMILVAHGLPVECRIAQKAGANPIFAALLRVAGALALGAILHFIYDRGGFLTETARLSWISEPLQPGWAAWLAREARTWAHIFGIIVALVVVLRLLRATRIDAALLACSRPLLAALGIKSDAAARTVMVGMTLGLSYGGAYMIRDAQTGAAPPRERFCALALLCLAHSLIEDTLALVLFGAHLSGVLWARLAFAVVVCFALARIVYALDDARFFRFFGGGRKAMSGGAGKN